MIQIFQSTLPVWGATSGKMNTKQNNTISIHAPRVGSDLPGRERRRAGQTPFQSTLPVWGATQTINGDGGRPIDFNPRSPCGERLSCLHAGILVSRISIHAPRVGSDGGFFLPPPWLIIFQSTLPVWGATIVSSYDSVFILVFQSTLPVWGATRAAMPLPQSSLHFNPRSPCGERPVPAPCTSSQHFDFNPRSPCGERLLRRCDGFGFGYDFNPRSPCGERPASFFEPQPLSSISIHAPRVGSDVKDYF